VRWQMLRHNRSNKLNESSKDYGGRKQTSRARLQLYKTERNYAANREKESFMKRMLLGMFAVLWLGAGFSSRSPVDGRQATFPDPTLTDPIAAVTESERGINIEMGVANRSQERLEEQEPFAGHWQLLNRAGQIRAEGYMHRLGRLEPGEARSPLHWEGELAEGSYWLLWGAPAIGATVTRFEIVVDDGVVGVQGVRSQAYDSFLPATDFP
jgi:hypothetical protein